MTPGTWFLRIVDTSTQSCDGDKPGSRNACHCSTEGMASDKHFLAFRFLRCMYECAEIIIINATHQLSDISDGFVVRRLGRQMREGNGPHDALDDTRRQNVVDWGEGVNELQD